MTPIRSSRAGAGSRPAPQAPTLSPGEPDVNPLRRAIRQRVDDEPDSAPVAAQTEPAGEKRECGVHHGGEKIAFQFGAVRTDRTGVGKAAHPLRGGPGRAVTMDQAARLRAAQMSAHIKLRHVTDDDAAGEEVGLDCDYTPPGAHLILQAAEEGGVMSAFAEADTRTARGSVSYDGRRVVAHERCVRLVGKQPGP